MNVGNYIRIDGYISKIGHLRTSSSGETYAQWKQPNGLLASGNIKIIEKSSPQIIDLIEYMDMLYLKKPIKIYGINKTVKLFNPVRCDGFTTYDDGTHCIILDLDHIVDVNDLEIEAVITLEQMEAMQYRVEE